MSEAKLALHQTDPSEIARIGREYLAFQLAGESYALPLPSIREILKAPPITEIPRADRDILGIISVRGRITTVIDLRRRLQLEELALTKDSRILLVDRGDEVIGVLVDLVHQVYRLEPDEIELSSVMGGDVSDHFIGIGRPGGEESETLLILLDPFALLRRN